MGRTKKSTSHYDDAVMRQAGMKSISPTLDLGNGLTVAAYEASITEFRQKLDEYNTSLSEVDLRLNTVKKTEKKLRDLSERMINGVASKYGKDSDEYEMAGGIRKSDRKKIVRIKKAA